MKHVWTKITQSTFANMNFNTVTNDFLKMFLAAIMVGLTFSVIAAAVSLMLAYTSTAYASQLTPLTAPAPQTPSALWVSQHGLWVLKDDAQLLDGDTDNAEADVGELLPSPGHFHLGDGCGSTPIIATERDWQVTIKGDMADIQVMQTFVIHLTDGADLSIEESGYFGAVLPRGAIYTSFRVQMQSHDLLGKYAGNTNWDSDDTIENHALKASGMLRVFEYRHPTGTTHLSSDSIHGLKQGETVVVTYRYSLPVDNMGRHESGLRLTLHDDQLTGEAHGMARNSVWIQWANAALQPPYTTAQPKAIINAPRGLNTERSKNGKRIIAASFENSDENIGSATAVKKDNNQFQLRWAL